MVEEKRDKEWICIYCKKQNCNYHKKVVAGLQKELKEKLMDEIHVVLDEQAQEVEQSQSYSYGMCDKFQGWADNIIEKVIDEVFGKNKRRKESRG